MFIVKCLTSSFFLPNKTRYRRSSAGNGFCFWNGGSLHLGKEIIQPFLGAAGVGPVEGGCALAVLKDREAGKVDQIPELRIPVAEGNTGIEDHRVVDQLHHVAVVGSLGDAELQHLVVVLLLNQGLGVVAHELQGLTHHVLVADGTGDDDVVTPVDVAVLSLIHVVFGHGQHTQGELGLQVDGAQLLMVEVSVAIQKVHGNGGVIPLTEAPDVGALVLGPVIELLVHILQAVVVEGQLEGVVFVAGGHVDVTALHEGRAVGVPHGGEAVSILVVAAAVTVVGVEPRGQGEELVQGPGAVANRFVGDNTPRLGQLILVAVKDVDGVLAEIAQTDELMAVDGQALHDLGVPVGLVGIKVGKLPEIQSVVLGDEIVVAVVGMQDTELVVVVTRHDRGGYLVEDLTARDDGIHVLVLNGDAQILLHHGVHLVDGIVENVNAALLVAQGLGIVPGAGGVEAHHTEDLVLIVGLFHVGEEIGLGLGGSLGGLPVGGGGILGVCAAGGEREQHESRQSGGDQSFQVGHGWPP